MARQYSGSAGEITNCQIGVFAAHASRHGHAFIDRALCLPKAWTGDPARRAVAHVPPRVGFATKPRLAERMVARDRRSWIGKPEVAGTAAEIAQGLDPTAWRRLSAGEGTKGPRLGLADLAADEYGDGATGVWTRGLLIRRSLADGDRAYFTTWCPARTTIETLAAVEGQRWAIEDAFETAKNELGLDHNETRSTAALSMARLVPACLAGDAGLPMLAVIRHRANASPPPKP